MKALTFLLVLFSATLNAEEPQKQFVYFNISKGQIGEACPQLKKGQQLTYKVKSSKPVKFNFHYHQGEEVSYPVADHETQLIEKIFIAEMDEVYCLMWTGLKDNTTVEMEYFVQ